MDVLLETGDSVLLETGDKMLLEIDHTGAPSERTLVVQLENRTHVVVE